MRTQAPALLAIFRSALQARHLLRVLTSDKVLSAADLARVLGEPEPTGFRETRRLLKWACCRASASDGPSCRGRSTRMPPPQPYDSYLW